MYAASNSSPRRRPRRRAAAAAELAILGSVLAFILVASVDFARVFFAYLTITNCATMARLRQSGHDSLDRHDRYQERAVQDGGSLSPALAAANVSSSTGSDANSDPYVAVTATYSFTTLVTYPGIPHTMPLSRTVKMRVLPGVPGTQS